MMENNDVEILRGERFVKTVALTRFLEEYEVDNVTKCYGFVEGKDDPSYYRRIINNNLPKKCEIKLYPCDGKKIVKYIHDKLDWKIYSNLRIVFFMDRDLSPIIEDKDIVNDTNVYITDKYSIENDILCEETLHAVMEDILGFPLLSDKEKLLISELFIKQEKIFETLMIPIMANIIFWKRNSISPANYNNLNIKNIVKITNVIFTYKDSEQTAIETLYNESGVGLKFYNKEIVDKIYIEIEKAEIINKITRGKYLATFFILLSNSIHDNYNEIGLRKPTGSGRCLNPRDIFETVALRCKTPESLQKFIKNTIECYFNLYDNQVS